MVSRTWFSIASAQLLCLLLTVLIASSAAFGQGGSFIRQVTSGTVANGGTGQVIPYANVLVCTSAGVGTPCSPTANIYSDQGLTQPLGNPFAADINGVYSFFVATGEYLVQESAPIGAGFSYSESFLIFSNGTGTVSSVSLSLPSSVFSVTGSPCTISCSLSASLNLQSPYTIFGNFTGSSAVPTFGSLVAAQIPSTLNATSISGNLSVTGNETVGGTLGITGNTTLTAGLTVGTTLGVTGNTTIGGTLSAGATTVSSLSDSGNASIGGTLGVTGATTLSTLTAGNTALSGLTISPGSLLVSAGNAIIGGTLTVESATSLQLAAAIGIANQQSAHQWAGTGACISNAASVMYGTAYNSIPALVVFDQTTKGGINLTASSASGFTVSCTGATDQFAWIAIGNPN